MIIRQGDLTLVSVDKTFDPPATVGDNVLALGEESGHWHTLSSSFVVDVGTERYVSVVADEGATLSVGPDSHSFRHAAITVPKGTWQILGEADEKSLWLGQREYTPEAIRRVAD